MKAELIVRSTHGKAEGTVQLPHVFETPYRPDVIRRAYINLLSHMFQEQGRYPAAGELVSAESRNTGLGIARLARIRGQGFSRAGQAAGVAGVRAGRIAHPPESWKDIYKKINKKERQLALSSAIAATSHKDIIVSRGHRVEGISDFPIIASDSIESITKSRDLVQALLAFGLAEDLSRTGTSKVKGTKNGSRAKSAGTSALVVVRKGSNVCRLATSIPGIDVKDVDSLSVLDLAPGGKPIRLTVFSKGSLECLEKYGRKDHLLVMK
jgi:large subunit ribosomal protein L4e